MKIKSKKIMTNEGLTERQLEVLFFIFKTILVTNAAPTYKEIADQLCVVPETIQEICWILIDKNCITMEFRKHRSIKLTSKGEEICLRNPQMLLITQHSTMNRKEK